MIMGIAETEETIKRLPEFDLQSPIQWILDQILSPHEDLDAAIINFPRLMATQKRL